MKSVKIIAMFTAALLALGSLVACGESDSPNVAVGYNTLATEATTEVSPTTTEAETTPPATEPPTTKPTTTPATTVPNLSESCDKIMASGYDIDGNYYELVANETEDYTGTTIEFGIIKNNEWACPLVEDHPFLGKPVASFANVGNLLRGGSIYDAEENDFKYIGNGCFCCYHGDIWNANTQQSFDTLTAEASYGLIYPFDYEINNEGLYLMEKDPHYGSNDVLCLLDVNTMTVSELPFKYNSGAGPYSEGLFYLPGAFYDKDGNKVLDVSQFNPIPNSLRFIDGKCTFRVYNDQNHPYDITIDKSGEVIDSIKVNID